MVSDSYVRKELNIYILRPFSLRYRQMHKRDCLEKKKQTGKQTKNQYIESMIH